MKVIFLEHVLHVAKAWEVKEVSSGYASNYLFPKKLAKAYTETEASKLRAQVQKKESERRMLLWWREDILQKLEWQVFEFFLQSHGNKTLWSIKSQDIVSYVHKKYHIPLHKKHIVFQETSSTLKTFWDHEIYIDLWNNFAVKALVRIVPSQS